MASSIRSWRYSYADASFGDLHQERIVTPTPSPGQVLIRVHAASLNPIDIHRLTGQFASPNVHQCIGFDYAGVVIEGHSTSGRLFPGQHVFGSVHESADKIGVQGALQEYITIDEDRVAAMPSNLTFTEAAAMVVVSVTAIQAFDRAKLQAGESVLITGGSGGVGTAAIQIAKAMFTAGAILTTVRSADRDDICRLLGANGVFITNGQAWPLAEPAPCVNVVLDCTAQGTALRRLFCQNVNTRLVSVSTFNDPEVDCFGAKVGSEGTLSRLIPFLESGAVAPVIAKTFGFAQVYKALEFLRYGRPIGKVVIDFDIDDAAIAA